MNKEYDDLLNAPKIKSTKEAETDFIKALERRRLGIQTKKSNVSSYELQVSAEDVLVRKEFKELRCEMPGTPRSTFLMVFSPDGTKVASTHGNHNIYVTDIRTGKNIRTLIGHPRTPWCIAFHPTSNQILASGCLGGQVRIWDLSGGSEVWTSDTETVIASIAFHPDDRLLVIATYNELYFWDWSKPEPFMHVATGSIKEKVRYVAFDKLGHKLITGISNSPQTRWERVRAPVPVPRQADRAASPYRRRITPRLITNIPTTTSSTQSTQRNTNREPLSAVPERERRITACYRNLVREYELLVHRYLQIYRPPTMIDQGTDPMEIDLSSIANGTHSSTRTCSNPINLTTTSTNNLSMPGPSGINTQRLPASGVENVTPHTSGPNIKRLRLISTIGTQTTTTTTTSLSRESMSRRNFYDGHPSTSNGQNVCISTNWNPIDLSRCSTSVSENATSNNTYTNRPSTSSAQIKPNANGDNSQTENVTSTVAPLASISATQAYETTPSIPSDMLLLTPSEICSLRRNMRNIRSTQTQSTDISDAVQNNESTNVPSTSGTHNRNERRNSAPASTISEDQNDNTQSLRRGDSEESLILNTNSLQQNMNLIDGVKKGTPTIIIEKAPPQNCTSQFQTSSTSKLVVIRSSANQNSTQSTSITQTQSPRRLLIISTSLGTQTSANNNQQPNENSDNFKMRIRCSNLSNNSPAQNTASLLKKREDILEQIKNLVQNQNDDSNNQPSTSSQGREFLTRSNLTNLLEGAEKIFSKYLLSKRVADRTAELNQSQSLTSPSTSAEHICTGEHNPNNTQSTVNPAGSADFASSSTSVQPETKNPSAKFYEPRKRVYPGFSKKSRRPVLDSSSDSSSSDEDDRSKRHICSSRFPLHSKHFHLSTATNSKSVQNKVPASTSILNTLQNTQGDSHTLPNTSNTRKPLNYNAELELLVTDLLASTDDGNAENTSSPSTSRNVCATVNSENDRICGTCGGSIEDRCSTQPINHTKNNQSNVGTCARTNSEACPRSTVNINTRTTNTTVYTSPGHPRRRFFSHRLSAFYPTRIQNLRPHSRLRRSTSYLSPGMRNRLRTLNTLHGNNRLPFHVDEVVNYSERVNSEEEIQEQPEFHPFDPPPEFATINPENIGIGNMYSNIVQELESSLNDVRNIRASNRLGETSDMLSSFSGRLESIMNQSNAILRNLRTSIDTLTPSDQNVPYANNYEQGQQTSRASEPQFLFNDRNFFLREQRNSSTNENTFIAESTELLDNTTPHDDLFSNHNAIATDHTYPLNSRNSQTNTNNMTPLMASLHLTVSHIQRQARLLRQQVESIERIDRAMLEVAQLQMMRQLFVEIQRYFRGVPGGENRNAVSSVRQMMAGTRISDSSPYDSPNEETSTENQNSPAEAGPSTSNVSAANENQNTAAPTRTQCRKTFPRCIFFMQRNSRRSSSGNILQRRSLSRERMMRRYLPRRTFTYRSLFPPVDLTTNNNIPASQVSSETLLSRTRRLEHFLMEHGRYIGRVVESRSTGPVPTDKDEYRMMLRLNLCRTHMNNILGQSEINNPNIRRQTSSVTADGVSRYGARDILTSAAETLTRFIESGANNTPSIRSLLWDVIDLSLLLSEILLLQIVDSIPPPTGMNLDPERESLSARIDQMCSRMLQSRLSGHSQQLTRSLRLTRLAVRHASRALDQTYTARRNAMLPSGNDRDQRRELLEEINNCLRNIRRHHTLPRQSTVGSINSSENLSMREWYRTIHGLISRYSIYPSLNEDRLPVNDEPPNDEQPSTSAANINNETGEENEQQEPQVSATSNVQQGSSDDDNEPVWYNNNIPRERARPLYRTNNVYLLNNEDSSSSSSRNRPWNVPTVQVNDVPISQYQSPWHPRFLANRQRLSERLSELRTYPVGGLFRPRFLHPLYAGVNPFDADLDDPAREQIYDSDIISTVNPNHRIQVWEFSTGIIPNINNALKNVVVNECKIHNDASVDIATDGCILVTLLPSGGYLNVTNRLGVYSLDWESLGQCLYVATFEQNAVSVSLSPLSRHLVVGLASRRVSIMPSDNWTMARIFMLDDKPEPCTQLSSVREVEQYRDPNHMSVNCIRWLPISGQGLVYATNTGQLRVLT